jgi:hypothetical protein
VNPRYLVLMAVDTNDFSAVKKKAEKIAEPTHSGCTG